MRGVGHIAHNVTSIYTSYNVQQLGLADAAKRVRDAEERFILAQIKGDPIAIAVANDEVTKSLEDRRGHWTNPGSQ